MGEFNSFVSRLVFTVATLYGRKIYSDITVRLSDKEIPAHKFVLSARSEIWREDVLADMKELGNLILIFFSYQYSLSYHQCYYIIFYLFNL